MGRRTGRRVACRAGMRVTWRRIWQCATDGLEDERLDLGHKSCSVTLKKDDYCTRRQ